ncbi:hypothetical protein M2440_000788 [Methylorubrum extorquens]|nr:hypothetical protein [Methylorubrum extorquens]
MKPSPPPASVVFLRTAKKPWPSIAILVETPVETLLPWIELVSSEKAPTEPAVWLFASPSTSMSTKLVSMRL